MFVNMFLPHTILWILTFATSVVTLLLLWPRRHMTGGWYTLGYAAGLMEWTLAGIIEAMVIGTRAKVLFARIEYIGFIVVVPFAYLFVKRYLSSRKLTTSEIIPVFIVPIITLVLAWTNDFHHLLWTSFTPGSQALNILVYNHGPWFYVNAAYNYLLVILTIIMLIKEYPARQKIFRRQVAAILFALAFPLITCTTYMLNIVPVPGMDTTALGFAIAGFIIVYAIYRLKFLDMLPVARQKIIDNMRDGVIVVDSKRRVVDINPAAQKFMLINGREAIGQPVTDLLPKTLSGLFEPGSENITSYEMLARDLKTYVNIYAVPLEGKKREEPGVLITLQDITSRWQAEMKLYESNLQLQRELKQIEMLQDSLQALAVRDPLTNLYNRRYLEETLEREISRAQRTNSSVSVLMIDFDNFKELNDRYSHLAGDQALQSFAETLKKTSRREDVACRYGGDEFVLILPDLNAEDAVNRAESWRRSVSDLLFETPLGDVSITVSIGLSSYPQNGTTADELIHAADEAMYAAKKAGKNLVRQAVSDEIKERVEFRNLTDIYSTHRD